MTFKHMIIIMIFLCFAFSLSSVSASDNADIDNITMVDNEIELEDSKIIENIDELASEIQNAAPNSTIKLEKDIIVNQDAKCRGLEISENILFDGQGHKIDGNSSDMDF